MKKTVSVLLGICILFSLFGFSINSESENLLQTNLADKKGIVMNVATGAVSDNDRFNSNGALATVTDGNEITRTDVYGALDWDPPRYVGVLFTLDTVCTLEDISVISGYSTLHDYYRIYVSDSIANLYTDGNMVADNLDCDGAEKAVPVNKQARFIAVLGVNYTGNLRIVEIKASGYPAPEDPHVPNSSDYAAGLYVNGNKLLIGTKSVSLQGVNIPHLSWSADGDGNDVYIALNTATNIWDCPIIRVAVNPQLYLNGGKGKSGNRTAQQYRELVDDIIGSITAKNIVAVLDCHAYSGVYDDVVAFWDIVAPRYDGNELVIYDLVNEPISSWEVWFEGGNITLPDANSTAKTSIGMPALIDRIRAVSDNVIAVGGIDWAYNLANVTGAGFASFASQRANVLGMDVSEYESAYSISAPSRKGRGIMLSSHIYSNSPLNWAASLSEAKQYFPVLIGEYNPYYRDGVLSELNAQETAYLQKIFRLVSDNGFSSTAWALGAEPYLTDHAGNITAIGTAVKEFVNTGKYESEQPENLIYQYYSAATAIVQQKTTGNIWGNNGFINQAHSGSNATGTKIVSYLIDSDTATHYDIYAYDDYFLGMVYQLDGTYPCYEVRMTSGLQGYPDRYRIFASANQSTIFSSENLIEDFSVDISGNTLTINIDRPVRYIAFLAQDYVRIKEVSLLGTVFGDLNVDREVNEADLTELRKRLLGEQSGFTSSGDVNNSGEIDICDLVALKNRII